MTVDVEEKVHNSQPQLAGLSKTEAHDDVTGPGRT